MEIRKLIECLTDVEKLEAFRILGNEIIKEPKREGFVLVEKFCRNVDMTTRLRNVLLANCAGEYVELIDSNIIHKFRNASMNTETEFINVRGF